MQYIAELGRPLTKAEADFNFESILTRYRAATGKDIPITFRRDLTRWLTNAEIDRNFQAIIDALTAEGAAPSTPLVLRRSVPAPLSPSVVDSNFSLLDDAVNRAAFGAGPYPSFYARFDSGATTLDPRVTFARASTSSYWRDASLRTAAVNEPVFEDGALRLEPQATNRILFSSDLTNGGNATYTNGWRTNNVSVTKQSDAKIGDVTSVSIAEMTATQRGIWHSGIVQNTSSGPDNVTRQFLLKFISGSGRYLHGGTAQSSVGANQSTVVTYPYNVDLSAGTTSEPRTSVVMVTDGWILIKKSATSATSQYTLGQGLAWLLSDRSNLVADAGETLVGFMQAEPGLHATSLIKTTGTAATRAADTASITGANFPLIPFQGAFVFSGSLTQSGLWMQRIVDASSNGIQLSAVGNQLSLDAITGGIISASRATTALANPEGNHKVALAWYNGAASLFVDGAKIGADIVCDTTTIDRLLFNTAADCIHRYQSWQAYKTRPTDLQLQGLTS